MRNCFFAKVLAHSMRIIEFFGKPLQQYFGNLNFFYLFVELLNHFELFFLQRIFDLSFRFALEIVHDLYGVREQKLDRQVHQLRQHHFKTHAEQTVFICFKNENANFEYRFPAVLYTNKVIKFTRYLRLNSGPRPAGVSKHSWSFSGFAEYWWMS